VSLESDISLAHTPDGQLGVVGSFSFLLGVARFWRKLGEAEREGCERVIRQTWDPKFWKYSSRALARIYNFQIVLQVVKNCLFELWPCRISDSPLLRYTDRHFWYSTTLNSRFLLLVNLYYVQNTD
jgi:hypothetical protein